MKYTAQFDTETRSYTVTWVDGNGETLKEDTLNYGETPEYTGETPTKAEIPDEASYEFNIDDPWSPAITSVTRDVTYTAQFIGTYAITPPEPTDGAAEVAEESIGGEPVALYMYPDDGYGIAADNITVTGKWSGTTVTVAASTAENEENVFIFTMPEEPVTIEAEFSELFELYLGEMLLTQAEVSVNGNKVDINDGPFANLLAGSLVTLTIKPNDGYRIRSENGQDSVFVSSDSEVIVTKTEENTYTFTMPEEPASLEVTLDELYQIVIEYSDDYGGDNSTAIVTATVNGVGVTEAYSGDTIVLNIELFDGNALSSISYWADDSSYPLEPQNGVYSFEMPQLSMNNTLRIYVILEH